MSSRSFRTISRTITKSAHSVSGHGLSSPSRRQLLQALPLIAISPLGFSQQAAPVAVRKLHNFEIRVSDPERSLRFYQDVFGATVQARQADRLCLRIGPGPRFFSLRAIQPGEQPGFAHIGLSVADFSPEATQSRLAEFGILPSAVPASDASPLSNAMQSWIQRRGDTRELFFTDIEGIRYQLAAEDYCGGGGVLGNQCSAPEPAPGPGLFELVDINHFTTFLANSGRANDFYTRAFGKGFQAYQGAGSPVIGIGDGLQFLMYVGGSETGRPSSPGRIDHVCFSMNNFAVEEVLAKLTEYGLSARGDAANEGPLMHWVSMRMPNRGGAEGGTPEVYFSDPDGIRIQLQDVSYCGGGGYLGDSCPPLA